MTSEMLSKDVNRIGDISTKIREAIRMALPAGPEQFMTVMVPGKVVNYDDYTVNSDNITLPLRTELNQAILCDDMPTFSPVQLGPTGRSVARSYANTISHLVSAQTNIGGDPEKDMSEDQRRYKNAMAFLTQEQPGKDGMTLIELYTEKQSKYTKVLAEKNAAFNKALIDAKEATKNKEKPHDAAKEYYDRWVQENARTWRNCVQAAYMDWVISGKKEEVDYWFSVVDQDSALSRVEQSKEIMRWAVVQDTDGSCEYQKVKLEPTNWANLCKTKMKSGTNQTRTVEWYTFEISRLEQLNSMLTQMKTNPPKFPPGNDGVEEEKVVKAALDKQMKEYLDARQAYLHPDKNSPTKRDPKDPDPKVPDPQVPNEDKDPSRDEAFKTMEEAKKNLLEAEAKYHKFKMARLTAECKDAQKTLLGDLTKDKGSIEVQIRSNDSKIADLKTQRQAELARSGNGAKGGVIDQIANDAGIPRALPDPQQGDTNAGKLTDPFTPISVEVSASSDSKTTSTTASSWSFGASASYGFLSINASGDHSEAHNKATAELASSSVKVSFEVMRVDIHRNWLRPELFYDEDLVPGPGINISPGFTRILEMINNRSADAAVVKKIKDDVATFGNFAYYPTGFLVACNVVLEITGNTSNLSTYMNTSSSSSQAGVSFGPFSCKASTSSSSTDTGSTCKTTASGCRIEVRAPQIIGWVSQMVPALPRLAHQL